MRFCLDDSPRFKMVELEATDSTNTFIANYQMPPTIEMALVTAEYQTSGRGQAGNHWESAPGCNLLFSILVRPKQLPASQLFALSEAIALSLHAVVSETLAATDPAKQHRTFVKWPNDIYVDDNKIAGILIENELCGQGIRRAIIGVGLNVNQQQFVSDAPNPISLWQLTGILHERPFLMEAIMGHFNHWYAQIEHGALEQLHAHYRQVLYRGQPGHLWPFADQAGQFMASIEGVEPDGYLVLKDAEGSMRRYAFKEVSFIHQTPVRPEPPTTGRPA